MHTTTTTTATTIVPTKDLKLFLMMEIVVASVMWAGWVAIMHSYLRVPAYLKLAFGSHLAFTLVLGVSSQMLRLSPERLARTASGKKRAMPKVKKDVCTKVHVPPVMKWFVLKVGTECSGLETPLLALKKILENDASDPPTIKHVFSTECDPLARKIIVASQKPAMLLDDCNTRPLQCLPAVDVYVAGPPCPDFSSAGKKQGDSTERGRIVYKCVDAIIHCRAKLAILENVSGMPSSFPHVVEAINARMQKAGYTTHSRVLDSQHFGLPQTRKRIYFVFIKKDAQAAKFVWPEKRPRAPTLSSLLDPITPEEKATREKSMPGQPGQVTYENLKATLLNLRNNGVANPLTKNLRHRH